MQTITIENIQIRKPKRPIEKLKREIRPKYRLNGRTFVNGKSIPQIEKELRFKCQEDRKNKIIHRNDRIRKLPYEQSLIIRRLIKETPKGIATQRRDIIKRLKSMLDSE